MWVKHNSNAPRVTPADLLEVGRSHEVNLVAVTLVLTRMSVAESGILLKRSVVVVIVKVMEIIVGQTVTLGTRTEEIEFAERRSSLGCWTAGSVTELICGWWYGWSVVRLRTRTVAMWLCGVVAGGWTE